MIRPVRPADEAQLGEIAFLTGFFGESAGRYFPEPQLFADLWIKPYLRLHQNVSFVAEVEGVLVGYILGGVDQAEYERALHHVILTKVIPGLILARYQRPWAALPYLLRTLIYPTPHASFKLYPAHLHLNLRPDSRGLGTGGALLDTFLARLTELGIPGVQLSTTDQNVAALALYRKAGFHIAAYRVSPLWRPWLGHSAEHLCLARSLRRVESRR